MFRVFECVACLGVACAAVTFYQLQQKVGLENACNVTDSHGHMKESEFVLVTRHVAFIRSPVSLVHQYDPFQNVYDSLCV